MQRTATELDLETSRVIRAPRSRVWRAWTDPERLAQWWIPRPAICRVGSLELRPGGAFVTEMSEDGTVFGPHLSGCFLDVVPEERIVYTNALTRWLAARTGWICDGGHHTHGPPGRYRISRTGDAQEPRGPRQARGTRFSRRLGNCCGATRRIGGDRLMIRKHQSWSNLCGAQCQELRSCCSED